MLARQEPVIQRILEEPVQVLFRVVPRVTILPCAHAARALTPDAGGSIGKSIIVSMWAALGVLPLASARDIAAVLETAAPFTFETLPRETRAPHEARTTRIRKRSIIVAAKSAVDVPRVAVAFPLLKAPPIVQLDPSCTRSQSSEPGVLS